jgi:hypothetical protein
MAQHKWMTNQNLNLPWGEAREVDQGRHASIARSLFVKDHTKLRGGTLATTFDKGVGCQLYIGWGNSILITEKEFSFLNSLIDAINKCGLSLQYQETQSG